MPYLDGDDLREIARWIFLETIADLEPDVLATLRALSPDAPLEAWAAPWGLADRWCLAYAAATRARLQRWPDRPACWYEPDGLSGKLIPDESEAIDPRLKDPQHFRWLVRFQVQGRSYLALSRAVPAASVQTVHEAITTLATWIDLTLRPAPKGWPHNPE